MTSDDVTTLGGQTKQAASRLSVRRLKVVNRTTQRGQSLAGISGIGTHRHAPRRGTVLTMSLGLLIGLLVLAVAFTSSSSESSSDTLHVPSQYSTIQAAIDAAWSGDEIIVAPGTYNEAIDFLGKEIGLYSSGGPDVTIIDATGLGASVVSCVSGEGPGTIIDGFTITGGTGTLFDDDVLRGGGICIIDASPAIRGCVIVGNDAARGGGIVITDGASPTFINCVIRDNTADAGGGVSSSDSESAFINCVIAGNLADLGVGGGFNLVGSSTSLTNCTISDNSGTGVYNVFGSVAMVTNCILWGNTSQITNLGGGATITVSYSNVQGGYAGVGNINFNPFFVNAAAGNYRLSYFSPCVDAGDNTAPGLDGIVEDLDGNPRFVDDGGVSDTGNGTAPIVDMGAYERQITSAYPDGKLHVPSDFPTIMDAVEYADGGALVLVAPGTYNEAIDFLGKEITIVGIQGPEMTILDGTGLGTSIVRFASGEGYGSWLSGFTITNGSGTFFNGQPRGGGVFILNSNPMIVNCIFEGNGGVSTGGALYSNDSNPRIFRCTFRENSAGAGGAIYSTGGVPELANCLLYDNTASQGAGMYNISGSQPVLTNCTYHANAASTGGAIVNAGGATSASLVNTILWANTPDQILNQSGGSASVTYSNIQGGYAGTGNINIDPRFVDAANGDYRLDAWSLCIDSGDNNAVVLAGFDVDLDDNHRFIDDAGMPDTGNGSAPLVDMGAYERQIDSPPVPGIIHVPADFPTILHAVHVAADGAEIIVAPGTYNESISLIGKSITLRSSDGPDATIIDATGLNSRVVRVDGAGPGSLIEGFTFTGGVAQGTTPANRGGGMYITASEITLSNCTFAGNLAEWGGGLHVGPGTAAEIDSCVFTDNEAIIGGGGAQTRSNVSAIFMNCHFEGNAADQGAGANVNADGVAVFDACAFITNVATGSGGGVMLLDASSSGMFDHCLFDSNIASIGGGLRSSALEPTITNCTFTDNQATSFGGGCFFGGGSPLLVNTVFAGNTSVQDGSAIDSFLASPELTNCTIVGNTGGLAAVVNGDTFASITNTIIYGNGPGQIELLGGGSTTVTHSAIQGGYPGTGNIDADPLFIDPANGNYRLSTFSPATDSGNNAALGLAGITEDLDGNPRFFDGNGNGIATVDMGAYERQSVPPTPSGTIHVPVDFGTLQSAINYATNGAEIIVAPGMYIEAIDFSGKVISVTSSHGPGVTILDGTGLNSSVVVCTTNEGPNTVLDGFTIRHGTGLIIDSQRYGGGMYISGASPTIQNCWFESNVAQFGGAVYAVSSSSKYINCKFIGNNTSVGPFVNGLGGAIYHHASFPTIVNCLFNGNLSSSGGALWLSGASAATVTNCTIAGNQAIFYPPFPDPAVPGPGGAMQLVSGSTVTLVNSILFGNGDNQLAGTATDYAITYSNVMGGWAGEGNIDQDPMFDFGLRLLPDSPCIDAGNSFAPGLSGIWTDLDGNLRFMDGNGDGTATVDMGAYEFQTTAPDPGGILHVPSMFPGISQAVRYAANGAEIIVAPGTYNESIDFSGKTIVLRSSGGPDTTIVDATGLNARVVTVDGATPGTLIEGFTFTGGVAQGTFPANVGGGMYITDSDITVVNCIFTDNLATWGGGLYVRNNTVANIDSCLFTDNEATNGGGGMYITGSGITLLNCDFVGNESVSGSGQGGGIMLDSAGSCDILACTFEDNSANRGGGVFISNMIANLAVTNSLFANNIANESGSAIYNTVSLSSLAITNSTFGGNGPNVSTIHNTFSNPTITNSIIWGNAGTAIFNDDFSVPTVTYSAIQGGYAGTGNTFTDPRFVDPANGDFRLGSCSPAVDAGNNAAPDLVGITTDLDGNPRFVDDAGVADSGNGAAPLVDMGAYERQFDTIDSGTIAHVPAQFPTIQSAIDAFCVAKVGDGGEIIVAPGTYNESIDFRGRTIVLRGSGGAEVTTIDATGLGARAVRIVGSGAGTKIQGFTITGGTAIGAGAVGRGGGIYASQSELEIAECVVSGNTADDEGGGIYVTIGTAMITDCLVENNTAGGGGGGIRAALTGGTIADCVIRFNISTSTSFGGGGLYLLGPGNTLLRCTVEDNTSAANAGGVYMQSSGTIDDCVIRSNSAAMTGGGMTIVGNGPVTVIRSTVAENMASDGGGIRLGTHATIRDSMIVDNIAATIGGGVRFATLSPVYDQHVVNTIIAGNAASTGGGAFVQDGLAPTLTNCTIVGNSATTAGAALYADGLFTAGAHPVLTNCIVRAPSGTPIALFPGAAATVTYSNVEGGFPGIGNIDADPLVVDPLGGDLRLTAGSPCIDAGDNEAAGLFEITMDLDGNPRFVDDPATPDTGNGLAPIVDMGAYEFQPSINLCPADLTGEGNVDSADLLILLSAWGKCGAICPADLTGEGVVDSADLLILLSAWGPCP